MGKVALADAQAILGRVREDPEWFSTTILGHDPWETPREIMRAIARPRARVAIKACHASAKTFTAAEIVLWWVYSGGIAITTAPSWVQVQELLWGEIHDAYARARFPLGGVLNQTELRVGPQCYARGLSTDQGVRFQGFHGRVLIVLDEAPGVRPDIWESIEGIRAGGDVRTLALGNPVIASGPFFDAFGRDRASWQTFTIDAFETPNLAGLTPETLRELGDDDLDRTERPYLVTRRWVREKLDEWGEMSPLWLARVRGRFPVQGEDSLISLAWLEAARVRDLEPGKDDDWAAGLDVAGPGEDETVLVIRHGPRIVEMHVWTQPDPRGDVVAALRPHRDKRIDVQVDSIGIGYYMARHLESELALPGRLAVHDVNVGDAPRDGERYANLKAELYWGLRMRCQKGDFAGIADDLAISQLCGIRYKHNARGQVVIESKDDARKRGVRSPDRAEAVMLAFAPPPTKAGVWFI